MLFFSYSILHEETISSSQVFLQSLLILVLLGLKGGGRF